MFEVEQIYTNCLAQGAYYIESNGEAVIIDPLREVQPYIELAKKRGAKIKYIFETHFHADFVSGHIDLSKKTGAPIIYGPTTLTTGYDITIGKDNQEYKVGDITLRLLHTPGHTTESISLLLMDENGEQHSLFSGDTLFIGDVGRPDLAQEVIAELTQDKLARMLYHSLRDKIMPLNDNITVYPGHGAGSACGKNMSKETTDTLGNQKKTNYAMQEMSEDEFVEKVLDGLAPPPAYFPSNVLMNINGYNSIDDVLAKGTNALSIDSFKNMIATKGTVVLDARKETEYIEGHIPNSIFIGLHGDFAPWVGTVLKDIKTPIIFTAIAGSEEEVATRLARIGFDNVLGCLDGGIEAWGKAGEKLETIPSIDPIDFAKLNISSINVLDVRRASEFSSEAAIGTINTPLDTYENAIAKLDKNDTYYVHCAGGYRSLIFISLLISNGFDHLININGGLGKMKEVEEIKLTEFVCPTTLL